MVQATAAQSDHGAGAQAALAPFTRPAWVDSALYPFTDRFVEVDGCRVHYVDEGSGPPLLFLHGNPTWSFLYRNLIQSLKGSFRCIALDYPGFGLSTARAGYDFRVASHAEVVEKFIEALDLRGLTMMVQDWGGAIGLTAAARHPERLRALVIGNTVAWRVNGKRHYEIFGRVMGGGFGRFLNTRLNFFVKVMVPANVKKARLSSGVKAAYAGPFPTVESRRPVAVMPHEVLAAGDFLEALHGALPKLAHLPALIVWGDKDIAFKAEERETFERLFPKHRTQILAGAGHYIQEDAPDEIVGAIRAWWPTVAGEGELHG
jgi:haloalkane dehalogenase